MRNREGSKTRAGELAGSEGQLDGFTKGYVRKKARQLAGRYGFKRHDRDDIQQEFYLRLVKHLEARDPDDPRWKAFVAVTVDRRLASLIRDNKAKKRDHRRAKSIHTVIGEQGDRRIEIADTVTEHETPARRTRAKRSAQELADLKIDVNLCVADVSDPQHREFCHRLKYDSIAQIARDMNVPRTTLNAWLRKLRLSFEQRGLKKYLDESSSVR